MTTHLGRNAPNLLFADSSQILFAAFSPTGFCGLGIVPAFQSLKMYIVSFYHELVLG